jgi:putative glutamine amidotransferase
MAFPYQGAWLLGFPLDVTMLDSMAPNGPNRPRIGIPWRTSQEEAEGNLPKIRGYMEAVREAGGEPILLSLAHPETLEGQLRGLDGFVLPGSPKDVEPSEYGGVNHGKCAPADLPREQTDRAVLSHALESRKPVLAICYGCQLLNVFLGGTLVQDVRSETGTDIPHRKKDVVPEPPRDPQHEVRFAADSQLAKLAGATRAVVNSSHHQAIEKPGRNLRVTGQAEDGIVESVEWTGDANWVVGVQWHPERMPGDALASKLFEEFVAAAQVARGVTPAR